MSEQQPPADDLIGQKLGQYEILEEIGRGGMATVYRARQTSINRTVAIKVLPRHFLHDPGFYERFEREVDVIAHLEHPHILPIYDYGKDRDVPYIAMRYLGGGSMAQLIRRGAPKLAELDKPFAQMAQALDHAHRQGIIHRDLKPGNIMLDENGNAYLSDFGIARVLGSNLTGSAIIGTPAYMSPEQANGFPLDARSDIYSMGVVLFELITGKEPYQAETPMALLLKHINEPMPPLSRYRSDIPDRVEDVIAKATAKDPNVRYSSAGEMAVDFSEALRQTGSFARQTPRMVYEDSPTIMPDTGQRLTPPPGTGRASNPNMTPRPVTGTGYPQQAGSITGQQPITGVMQARSSLPLIIGGVILLAIVAIAGLVVLPSINSGPPPVTEMPATLPAPTVFPDAQRVDTRDYTVSIPRDWIPPQGFYDLTDGERLIHIWQESGLNTYVAVIIPNNIDIAESADFEQIVADYSARYYEGERGENLDLINADTAPDGTIRQSYRLFGDVDPPFPPGQLDAFFINRAPHFVVVEMYSSDESGNRFVPTFQSILDSLQVKGV
jgi:serine/threonine protein kinase